MPNRGEWSEPYVALRILGDKKLYIADSDGRRNLTEWMDIIELIRHETKDRIVKYQYKENNIDIDIFVNGELILSIPANMFLNMADELKSEIRQGIGNSFSVSQAIELFLQRIEMKHIKAASIDKSDIFLSIKDPRAGIVREHIGFSIKSEFGENPTLFNTASASAFIYHLENIDEEGMNTVNGLFDDKGHAAVSARFDWLISHNCNPVFSGLPVAARAGCPAFQENLDLIDPRLVNLIEKMLWKHFYDHETCVDLAPLVSNIIESNPLNLSRPEVKYPYMMKSFLYAAYCGMTASTLWDGYSQVNGGFIKVSSNGDVLAHYALESDAFKTYLYNNCYLEFPSTSPRHGNYGVVYQKDNEYFFRLNFQIRYK